ncbi:hypothetical protein [Paracoccus beibuensis]|uniref:hypothetical protein n=1 Tax=Paracoccus beibuensis TaxID=547602 RepID=UPI00223FAF92|nr:hypothetical protein [Paracoccus beibuensis]
MIGVVVWSNGSREKAIIWCEDQATLAYLQGAGNLVDIRQWPQPGDLVELETMTVGNLRHALNVSMISERCCPQIPEALAQSDSTVKQPQLRLVSTQDLPECAASAPSHSPLCRTHDLVRTGVAR